jgi:hypothetical protein
LIDGLGLVVVAVALLTLAQSAGATSLAMEHPSAALAGLLLCFAVWVALTSRVESNYPAIG